MVLMNAIASVLVLGTHCSLKNNCFVHLPACSCGVIYFMCLENYTKKKTKTKNTEEMNIILSPHFSF